MGGLDKLYVQDIGVVCGNWIESAQDRDRWRALVSTVKNLGFPKNVGNFLTNCKDRLPSEEEFGPKEFHYRNNVAIPGDRNVKREDFQIQETYNRSTTYVGFKNYGDTSNN
jgi:hypothetical protein